MSDFHGNFLLFYFAGKFRQHLLLQLSSSGLVLLQTLQRQGAGVQGQEQKDQGDPAHLPGRPILLDSHTKAQGGHHRAQKVHCQTQKGKGRV